MGRVRVPLGLEPERRNRQVSQIVEGESRMSMRPCHQKNGGTEQHSPAHSACDTAPISGEDLRIFTATVRDGCIGHLWIPRKSA
jgi:hypothetical protein